MIKLRRNLHVFYDDITHTYVNKDTQEAISGCTIVLKRYGISPNYSAVPDDVLRNASERGTKIHQEISDYINFGTCETEAQREYAKLGLDSIASEYLVSDNQHFATSIDIVLGDGSLVDIKTTSMLHINYLSWQLSISAYLFELQNPTIRVPKLYGLHYRHGSPFRMVEVPRIPAAEIERLLLAYINYEDFTPSPAKIPLYDTRLAEIYSLERLIADIKKDEERVMKEKNKLSELLFKEMDKNGVDKIENNYMTITKIAPSVRVGVDATKLKLSYPEIFNEVSRETNVKGFVKIRIKE